MGSSITRINYLLPNDLITNDPVHSAEDHVAQVGIPSRIGSDPSANRVQPQPVTRLIDGVSDATRLVLMAKGRTQRLYEKPTARDDG